MTKRPPAASRPSAAHPIAAGRAPASLLISGRPDEAESHHHLGIACAWQDRFVKALREFAAARRVRPDHGEARRHLAPVRALLVR